MKKKIVGIPFEEFKKEMLKRPGVRREYERLKPDYQIAGQMIEARIKNKMSQADLAKKAGTGQAVISRLEGANASPSMALLKRIAEALGTKFEITIQ